MYFKESFYHANRTCILFVKQNFHLGTNIQNKNLKNQAKVFQKLYNGSSSRSKKWYKNDNEHETIKFESTRNLQNCNSKNNIRRISVLNKLFMTHITDLMTTGSTSEIISGKGIQITGIKVSSDFTHLQVLWTSKLTDIDISKTLEKCAGILRHELCQLQVMGDVPLIKFIKDKTNENLEKITQLLKTIELEGDVELNEELMDQHRREETAPMAHDIFGIDRQEIITKIRSRLKKSTDAWDIYKNKCA